MKHALSADAVHVLADAAAYQPDGRPQHASTKIALLPHLNCVVAGRGRALLAVVLDAAHPLSESLPLLVWRYLRHGPVVPWLVGLDFSTTGAVAFMFSAAIGVGGLLCTSALAITTGRSSGDWAGRSGNSAIRKAPEGRTEDWIPRGRALGSRTGFLSAPWANSVRGSATPT